MEPAVQVSVSLILCEFTLLTFHRFAYCIFNFNFLNPINVMRFQSCTVMDIHEPLVINMAKYKMENEKFIIPAILVQIKFHLKEIMVIS